MYLCVSSAKDHGQSGLDGQLCQVGLHGMIELENMWKSSVAGVLSSTYLCMMGRLEERILGVVAHVSLLALPVKTWGNKKVCSGMQFLY